LGFCYVAGNIFTFRLFLDAGRDTNRLIGNLKATKNKNAITYGLS